LVLKKPGTWFWFCENPMQIKNSDKGLVWFLLTRNGAACSNPPNWVTAELWLFLFVVWFFPMLGGYQKLHQTSLDLKVILKVYNHGLKKSNTWF
jgi:hypothetical protein